MSVNLINDFDKLKDNFKKSKNTISSRILVLKKLKEVLNKNEGKLLDALYLDLRKSAYEGYLSELSIVYKELNTFLKNLKKWSKPKYKLDLVGMIGYFKSIHRPYGLALIITPFNYPVFLSLVPMIGALAAGNNVVVRYSSDSKNVARCMEYLIESGGLADKVKILIGNDENKEVIEKYHFDYIFFTGSQKVGKIMMRKAANDLVPITLELGGKSPCIVDKGVNLEAVAKRILFGKLLNAGQTCIAPDYLVVASEIVDELIIAIKREKDLIVDELNDKDWPKIVNDQQFYRLKSYLEDCKIVFGGKSTLRDLKMQLTLIVCNSWEHPALNNEIFGPIFPILSYRNQDELMTILNRYPDPLAFYLFTKNKILANDLFNSVRFGGACLNDTLLHVSTNKFPFGGVGGSGFGRYHGLASYQTFSYQSTILVKKFNFDLSIRFRPYGDDYNKIKKYIGGSK